MNEFVHVRPIKSSYCMANNSYFRSKHFMVLVYWFGCYHSLYLKLAPDAIHDYNGMVPEDYDAHVKQMRAIYEDHFDPVSPGRNGHGGSNGPSRR